MPKLDTADRSAGFIGRNHRFRGGLRPLFTYVSQVAVGKDAAPSGGLDASRPTLPTVAPFLPQKAPLFGARKSISPQGGGILWGRTPLPAAGSASRIQMLVEQRFLVQRRGGSVRTGASGSGLRPDLPTGVRCSSGEGRRSQRRGPNCPKNLTVFQAVWPTGL